MRFLASLAFVALCAYAQSTLDNQRITELAHTVSVEELDSIICSAPQVSFSLSPGGMAWLLQAGVSEHSIKTMAAKQNGRPCNGQAPSIQALPSTETPALASHALPAQSKPFDFPAVSLYGGYSYASVDTNGLGGRVGGNGFETSAAFGFNRWIGAESDFAAYYHDFPIPAFIGIGPVVHAKDFSFLGGPRISYGPLFFHTMVGIDRLSGSVPGISVSQDSFATALGGGVQLHIPRTPLAFRASVDYIITQHNIVSFGPGFAQNNIRVSTGIAYVIGSSKTARY